MKKINVKIVEGKTQDTVTKIPVTVIDKKSESVQKFKVKIPENECSGSIKLNVKVMEERQEEQKIFLKEK